MATSLQQYISPPSFEEPEWMFPEDGEVVDLQHRITHLESEMQELDALCESLESLRDIAVELDNPTEREISLLRAGAQAALTDTRVSVEALLPAVESAEGTTVSVEALNDVLKRLLKTVLEWMKNIWTYIGEFFKKVLDQTERLRRQNDNMRGRMEKASKGTLKQKKIELNAEVRHLSMDGKAPSTGEDIVEGLKRLRQQGDVIYKDYAVSLAKAGERLAEAIEGCDFAKPEDSLQKVFDAAHEVDLKRLIQLTKGRQVDDPRWKNGTANTLDPLPGNQSIFFFFPNVVGQDNLLAKSEVRRRKAITLESTSARNKKDANGGTMTTLTPAEGYEVFRLNKELLTMLTEYEKHRKWIEKSHKRVQGAIKKLESLQSKSGDGSETTEFYFQEIVKYGQAYTYWVKNPHVDLAAQIQKTVRATIIAANQSAANYSDPA